MQSSAGFIKSGGFKGVYTGLQSVAVGSAPGAAVFFATYDTLRKQLEGEFGTKYASLTYMLAAAGGEVMACLVRVPTENVKQKMQAGHYKSVGEALRGILHSSQQRSSVSSSSSISSSTYTSSSSSSSSPPSSSLSSSNSLVLKYKGFYTGYGVTIMREIPFAFIQFPLYEFLKDKWAEKQRSDVSAVQAAICGSAAGAVAAALTTPIDVVKTRLMLGVARDGTRYNGLIDVVKQVYAEKAMFSGITPRVAWISIGGFVFFGAFESGRRLLER